MPAHAAARVDIAKKCAMIAVETPNAPAKPKAFKAPNMDSALRQLDVSFKVQLRRLDGSTQREKIDIQSLGDFEEASIAQNLEILREQKRRMAFLHDFQNELRNNPVFREELKCFLASEKREQLVQFLQGWIGQMKKPSSEFLQLLKAS